MQGLITMNKGRVVKKYPFQALLYYAGVCKASESVFSVLQELYLHVKCPSHGSPTCCLSQTLLERFVGNTKISKSEMGQFKKPLSPLRLTVSIQTDEKQFSSISINAFHFVSCFFKNVMTVIMVSLKGTDFSYLFFLLIAMFAVVLSFQRSISHTFLGG